ncbi:MAG: hypothetical protein AAGD07_06995 [Planctomycetota bacterium]
MFSRLRLVVPAFCFALGVGAGTVSSPVNAQSAILAEIYGRGVHAYHSGNHMQAYELLSMAIDNQIRDPRAYYFRGIVASVSGRPGEANSDFEQGARLEARGDFGLVVGRSLARIQGPTRLKLESFREKARLEALAAGVARSRARYGELGLPADGPGAAAPRIPRPAVGLTPPPTPSTDNPFADDLDSPMVEENDAFEGALDNPLAQPSATADAGGAAPAGDANPFGGDSGAAADPFGAGTGGAASDPFGSAPAGDDPFGGAGGMDDPFGASGAMEDPFAN